MDKQKNKRVRWTWEHLKRALVAIDEAVYVRTTSREYIIPDRSAQYKFSRCAHHQKKHWKSITLWRSVMSVKVTAAVKTLCDIKFTLKISSCWGRIREQSSPVEEESTAVGSIVFKARKGSKTYVVFRIIDRLLSAIPNTTFWKQDLFPSWGERVGGTCFVGSVSASPNHWTYGYLFLTESAE